MKVVEKMKKRFLNCVDMVLRVLVTVMFVFFVVGAVFLIKTGIETWDVFPLFPLFFNFPFAGFCLVAVLVEAMLVWCKKISMEKVFVLFAFDLFVTGIVVVPVIQAETGLF